jgi:glycosyltransferase involved in cell wall biosynthesis
MAKVKQKVVHVTTLHPVFDIRIFQKECRSLARAGYDVTLIAPHERIETVAGVKIAGVPRINNRPFRMLIGGLRAYRLARSLRADIYHFHDPELLPWMARLKSRAKVVYDVHEDLAKAVLTKRWLPGPLRRSVAWLSRAAERYFARGMHFVLAEASYAESYSWAPSTQVLNLPRLEELADIQVAKHERPTVGYLGAVSASRGSIVTVKALGLLRRHGLEVAFECVGPVSERHRTELLNLAEELGVPITIHGYLPAPQGWSMMARCHAGLALLEAQPNYVRSYPTKIFEYMALGLPVVASNFPLYRELVEGSGCGICVDPGDVDAIAGEIGRVLTNPELESRMSLQGRTTVIERYSWDTEVAKLTALYAELLSAP